MFPKIANEKFFWGSVVFFSFFVFIFSFSTLYDVDTLTITEWFCKFFMIFFKIAIILVIHFIVEKFFSYSQWIEKQFALDFPQQIDKISSICFVILLSLSTIPLIIAFFFSDNFYDIVFIKYFGIAFNTEKLVSYIGTSIGVFSTMLALHWAIVGTIYTTQYANTSKEIQVLYFNLTRTKFLSIITCVYLVFAIFIYFYLSIENTTENVSFLKIIFDKIMISSYHSEKTISLISLIIFGVSSMLLVYYIRNSLNFINLSNMYLLYKLITIEVRWLFKKVTVKRNKNYQEVINKIVDNLIILQDKIQNDITHSKITGRTFFEIISDYYELIKEYWKIKNTIFYNTDWYPSLKRQNNITEVILSDNNAELARDILHIERWLFENNMLIINHLIANKSFALLNIYYDRIRKILSLEEKENLLSYNVPFFYETLNLLRVEIEKCFINILNNDILITNKNDINYYGLIANLNYVLGNIFMNSQAFIFKFTNEEINKIYPNFEEIIKAKTIQELCIKYPLINNEEGVKAYTKLFMEKNTEGQIITPKNNFTRECKIPLIKMELYNMLSSMQSIEDILQNNLKYFVENKMPYHFFDTFLAFISIKHEILINIEQYQTIYKKYVGEKEEQEKIQAKIMRLFNYQKELANDLTLIIKNYRDENYFIQKEFPSLLSNIYDLLLSMLIIHFKSKEVEVNRLKEEKRNTIKIAFHFMFTIQQIITKEQEKNTFLDWENYSISYFIPFIRFASIIGSGLQKEKNHQKDIYIAFIPIKSDKNIINHLKMMSDNLNNDEILSQFNPVIQPIEKALKTKDSVKTFLQFIENNLEEK